MAKKTYKITGMHCSSCALNIEWELEDQGYVARCNYAKQELEIDVESEDALENVVKKTIAKLGYKLE